jgi:hypothetical protein
MAQAVHAAGETGPAPAGAFAVVLQAKSETELLELREKLQAYSCPHHPIFEPDPPFNGQLMALGFPPGERDGPRRFLSKFPLFGKETKTCASTI